MNITIHVGLHKTATTTFQKQLFPACDKLNYLSGHPDLDAFVGAVTTQDPLYFDAATHRARLTKLVSSRQPNIISKESLCGALYAGVGKRDMDHRSSILHNLQAVVPEARILLVIRRQDSLAASLYRQYLKVGGTETIQSFYGLRPHNRAIYSLDRFRFLPYIQAIEALFPNGLQVLVFEDFLKNKDDFVGRLSNFIGAKLDYTKIRPINVSRFGSTGLEVTRIANRFFRNRLNRNGLMPSAVPFLQDHWPIKGEIRPHSRIRHASNEILGLVKEDNQRLERAYSLKLSEHGYY